MDDTLQRKRIMGMEKGEKLKVYLETSFVSYLTGGATADAKIAADQAYTRLWWNEESDKVDVFVSGYTIAECEAGNAGKSTERMAFLRGVSILPSDEGAEADLARKLVNGHAMPEGEATDALHIASAAIGGMDILLTWNCRHLANPHTLPKTKEILAKAGFICPEIMTPKTFLENMNMEV